MTQKPKLPSTEETLAPPARYPPDVAALKREISSLKKQLRARRGGEDLIIRAVQEAYEDPPDLRIPDSPPKGRKRRHETALLHVTDTQIGKITDSYSVSVADQRLQMLADKTILITEMRRSASTCDEIVVLLGGDIIEGELIFPQQAHQIEQSVFDQAVKEAPSILIRMLLKLLGGFPRMRVYAVPGNHGMPGGRRSTLHPRSNWDRVCYEVAKLALKGPDGDRLNARLTFDIAEKFYLVANVEGWGCLLIHGHEIVGYHTFPWYSANVKAWRWIESIKEPWDILYFGHHHAFASAELTHRKWFCGNTTESDNEYAQQRMAMGGVPSQRLQFFDAEYGIISDHEIYLVEPGERVPASQMYRAWQDNGRQK